MAMNVLIVDDEPDIRNFLVAEVEDKGHTSFTAQNGLEALEVLENHDIDLIISDIRMPKMSGVELLQQVKIKYPTVKNFVFITGFSKMDEKQAKELGATGLIFKPLNLKLLRIHL